MLFHTFSLRNAWTPTVSPFAASTHRGCTRPVWKVGLTKATSNKEEAQHLQWKHCAQMGALMLQLEVKYSHCKNIQQTRPRVKLSCSYSPSEWSLITVKPLEASLPIYAHLLPTHPPTSAPATCTYFAHVSVVPSPAKAKSCHPYLSFPWTMRTYIRIENDNFTLCIALLEASLVFTMVVKIWKFQRNLCRSYKGVLVCYYNNSFCILFGYSLFYHKFNMG